MNVINKHSITIEKILFKGSGALNGVVDNAAVVNNGDGTVRIPITGHGLEVGTFIKIDGTTNYDGIYEIINVPNANAIDITATYVIEVLAGTETYEFYFDVVRAIKTLVKQWRPLQYRLGLSGAGANEDMTVTSENYEGSDYNFPAGLVNTNGVPGGVIDRTSYSDYFERYDGVTINYANTAANSWGIEIVIEVTI